MKRASIIIIALLISHTTFSKNAISNFRDYYYGVCLSEVSIHEFDTYLALHENSENIAVKGYQSVIWFLWADYYVNPLKKWKCYSKGVIKLDQLIESYPDHLELRFLRLTIQDNVPKYLGYNKNLLEDENFIHKSLNKIKDKDLKKRITDYLCYNSIAKIK